MVDSNISRIPNPVDDNGEPCTVGTKDMLAFPDVTSNAANSGNQKDHNAIVYTFPGDKPGYVLFGHDFNADGTQTGLVNYTNLSTTTYCYSVDEGGRVLQFTEGGLRP